MIQPLLLASILDASGVALLMGIGLVGIAVAAVPLVVLRRKGPTFLVIGWLLESAIASIAYGEHQPGDSFRALVALLIPAAIIHVRALKPQRWMLADIGLATLGLCLGSAIAVISAK